MGCVTKSKSNHTPFAFSRIEKKTNESKEQSRHRLKFALTINHNQHILFTMTLLDTLFPPGACLRSGRLTVNDFEHLMAGVMTMSFALLTKFVSSDFVYGLFFVAFMLLQCSMTGFSPPGLLATHVLKLPKKPTTTESTPKCD